MQVRRLTREQKGRISFEHEGEQWHSWRGLGKEVDNFTVERPGRLTSRESSSVTRTVRCHRWSTRDTGDEPSSTMVTGDAAAIIATFGEVVGKKIGALLLQQRQAEQASKPVRSKVAKLTSTDDIQLTVHGKKIYFTGKVWEIRGQKYKIYIDGAKKQYRRRLTKGA